MAKETINFYVEVGKSTQIMKLRKNRFPEFEKFFRENVSEAFKLYTVYKKKKNDYKVKSKDNPYPTLYVTKEQLDIFAKELKMTWHDPTIVIKVEGTYDFCHVKWDKYKPVEETKEMKEEVKEGAEANS
jgi:hypothetical protein